jgi:uncharacterized protein YerC
MLLKLETIVSLLKRERNLKAIEAKTGLGNGTIARIARCPSDKLAVDYRTIEKLSDYFLTEFDYMKKIIIELGGE